MISFIRGPTVIKFIERDSRMVGPGAGGRGGGVSAEWDGDRASVWEDGKF